MKTLDKCMYWIENHTNLFVTIVFGIVYSIAFVIIYDAIKGN